MKLLCNIAPCMAALVVGLLTAVSVCAASATNVTATVVKVQRPEAMRAQGPDPVTIQEMVAAGIRSLTGAADESGSWRSLVSSNDVVGIKISTQTAPLHATHRAVVDAIASGLRGAGIPAHNIIVWDRDPRKIKEAGYEMAGDGTASRSYRVMGIVPAGWDLETIYSNVIVGKLIWGDLLFGREDKELNTKSHVPQLLTGAITKLINVPVWQDHDACGIRGALYNVSVGALDNTRRFETLGQDGVPAIAEICSMPVIRDKLVVTIADALVVGYAGGSSFKPQYAWTHNALYFSRDPVALDAIGLKLIDEKRAAARIPPSSPLAGHIQNAAAHGLGVGNLDQIEVRSITP